MKNGGRSNASQVASIGVPGLSLSALLMCVLGLIWVPVTPVETWMEFEAPGIELGQSWLWLGIAEREISLPPLLLVPLPN